VSARSSNYSAVARPTVEGGLAVHVRRARADLLSDQHRQVKITSYFTRQHPKGHNDPGNIHSTYNRPHPWSHHTLLDNIQRVITTPAISTQHITDHTPLMLDNTRSANQHLQRPDHLINLTGTQQVINLNWHIYVLVDHQTPQKWWTLNHSPPLRSNDARAGLLSYMSGEI
jgi:hypothetical protein